MTFKLILVKGFPYNQSLVFLLFGAKFLPYIRHSLSIAQLVAKARCAND